MTGLESLSYILGQQQRSPREGAGELVVCDFVCVCVYVPPCVHAEGLCVPTDVRHFGVTLGVHVLYAGFIPMSG